MTIRLPTVLCLVLALTPGCEKRTPHAAPAPASEPKLLAAPPLDAATETPPEPDPPDDTAATLSTPSEHHGLPWYVDAPEAALAQAAREDKLVLVDLWAPWCHTCLSMREYVLTAERLASVRDQLVLLAVDTERAANAPVLSWLPIAAWPTFYLVDAERRVHGRWVGAASPTQLIGFVRDGLRSRDAQRSGSLPPNDPLAHLIAGDRLFAEGELAEAERAYAAALSAAPRKWSRRPDALVARIGTLHKLKQDADCVALGLRALGDTGDAASATDFAYHALGCAESLEPRTPESGKLVRAIEARLRPFCFKGSPHMTPDDRGDACGLLRQAAIARGDALAARTVTEQRLRVLTAAAEGVPDAVALTYDFARMESLLQLGRGDEAIALLSARERALPDDYNPPHYLARLYRDLGRNEEGFAAVERALAKVEGPRRAGILGVAVDLLLALGRKDEASAVLWAQLGAYKALPDGQKQPAREEAVMARIEALEAEPKLE